MTFSEVIKDMEDIIAVAYAKDIREIDNDDPLFATEYNMSFQERDYKLMCGVGSHFFAPAICLWQKNTKSNTWNTKETFPLFFLLTHKGMNFTKKIQTKTEKKITP